MNSNAWTYLSRENDPMDYDMVRGDGDTKKLHDVGMMSDAEFWGEYRERNGDFLETRKGVRNV